MTIINLKSFETSTNVFAFHKEYNVNYDVYISTENTLFMFQALWEVLSIHYLNIHNNLLQQVLWSLYRQRNRLREAQ
jgi:hypothetical protein